LYQQKYGVKSDLSSARHQFTQFHCIGWPDCFLPSDWKHQIHESDSIVNLLDDVMKEVNTEKREVRILVHCSVGVGRLPFSEKSDNSAAYWSSFNGIIEFGRGAHNVVAVNTIMFFVMVLM